MERKQRQTLDVLQLNRELTTRVKEVGRRMERVLDDIESLKGPVSQKAVELTEQRSRAKIAAMEADWASFKHNRMLFLSQSKAGETKKSSAGNQEVKAQRIVTK